MKNIPEELTKLLAKVKDELDKRPHQYVVAYYKHSDDSLVGYHLSSFCQLTDDILQAKRYSGDNPYPQLETIAGNLKLLLDVKHETHELFYDLYVSIQQSYGGLTSKDIYLDAIYLAEGTPPTNFRFTIL